MVSEKAVLLSLSVEGSLNKVLSVIKRGYDGRLYAINLVQITA